MSEFLPSIARDHVFTYFAKICQHERLLQLVTVLLECFDFLLACSCMAAVCIFIWLENFE